MRSTELRPSVGYTKYLMLAQLREGLEAIAVYERAVEILTRDIAAAAAGSEVRTLQSRLLFRSRRRAPCAHLSGPPPAIGAQERALLCRQLTSAYCAMVEIYMTDCW